ncbi:MAG TPA: helix-turn-helix transcriptional regulator [Steroidobacteraceae bacterium]|nr:helix-turn-helix transcriptional regulator [Steroidobacteraceae bacterium]
MSNRPSLPQLSSRPCAGATPPPQSRPALAEGTLQAILDVLGPPLLLVDEAATPIFVNRRAARILARGDGLAIGPAGLTTRSRKATRELRAAIADAAANAHSSHTRPLNLHVTVARQLARPPWLVSVLPIGGAGTAGYAALCITESDVQTRIDPESAADYFLLTPRETDVAALLAAGRNSKEAARALHIGIGTVRTHLKSLFGKTGARSQTTLALKLQAFAIRE